MRSVVGTVLVVVCLSALILIHLVSVSSSDLPGKNSSPTRWYQLDSSYSFDLYKKEFHKKYESPQEETLRREIFTLKLKQILAHNSDSSSTWKMGVNQFTDRTKEEFSKVLGVRKDMLYASRESQERKDKSLSLQKLKTLIQEKKIVDPVPNQYPPFIDWRIRGVISAVKDQGQCGSCWSFASAETIESHWAIMTGELPNLSEQQILDCTVNPKQCGGTGGCGGGTTEVAYQTIINKQGGLSSEWTYPYNSYFGDDYECDFSSQTPVVAMLESYNDLPSNEYDPVMMALAYMGPLAISVDASGWDSYESGVFTGCNLQNPVLDHGVQLVGYGQDRDGNGDFWLVRNSWGAYWGEEGGYIRIARSDNITCGVDTSPADGDGCNHGPPNVTVCGPCGILYDTVFPVVKIN